MLSQGQAEMQPTAGAWPFVLPLMHGLVPGVRFVLSGCRWWTLENTGSDMLSSTLLSIHAAHCVRHIPSYLYLHYGMGGYGEKLRHRTGH